MLYYATGNSSKFKSAQEFLETFGIEIEQKNIDIHEIQSDSIQEVALDKAKKAYEILKQPLFVNDSGWTIPALNGFPGPYMKYMNEWLSADDFIRLMLGKANRTIILKQVVVYIDENGEKVFEEDSVAKILNEASQVSGRPSDMIVSFEDGVSLTEQKQNGSTFREKVWEDFVNWLKNMRE